jgi:hypothetical protein
MLIKPPFLFVLAFLGGALLSIYNTYRLIAQPRKVKKEALRGASKLPQWYPLRSQIIRSVHKNRGAPEIIFSVFITLIMIGATVFIFVAWFMGQ